MWLCVPIIPGKLKKENLYSFRVSACKQSHNQVVAIAMNGHFAPNYRALWIVHSETYSTKKVSKCKPLLCASQHSLRQSPWFSWSAPKSRSWSILVLAQNKESRSLGTRLCHSTQSKQNSLRVGHFITLTSMTGVYYIIHLACSIPFIKRACRASR